MLSSLISYLKKHRLLLIISIIYLLIRLVLLDHAFLLRGERDIAFTGYSLAHTGRDLYGNILPIEFFGIDMPTPFLSFYYSALWWILIPIKSVFTSRLPYVLATTSYIFLVYELTKTITKNNKLAITTSIIFAFSPGIYHLSRLALEVNIGMPVLLTGILLFLKKKRIWAYSLFVLSFFSYNGFRPLILPLLLFLELYPWMNGSSFKSFLKMSVISTVFFFALFGSSILIDGKMMYSRSSDIIFMSYEEIVPKVIYLRNTSIAPENLKVVLHNKITETIHYMVDVFVQGQDFQYLFFQGDKAAIYATTFTGQFFLILLPLYYAGFLFFGRNLQKKYLYMLGFIPVAFVPSLINIDYISLTIRSILSTVGYAYIIACGFVFILPVLERAQKLIKVSVIGLFIIFLGIELVYFSYNYVYRRPITMFEMFFQSEKDIGEYLLNSDQKYIIYDDSPRNIVTTYYFLKDKPNMREFQQLNNLGHEFSFDGHTIMKCPSSDDEIILNASMIVADSCLSEDKYKKWEGNADFQIIPFKDFSFRKAFFIYDQVPDEVVMPMQ
ncbi:MAG: hypothetical protein O3B87_04975 [bacterium]|nr:hypothetical protein [bacterium]